MVPAFSIKGIYVQRHACLKIILWKLIFAVPKLNKSYATVL